MSQSMRELGMQIAREQAAQAWQGAKTAGKQFDPDLAEEFAGIVYTWIVSAKSAFLGNEYYRGILEQTTRHLGCTEEAWFANVPAEVAAMKSALEQMAAYKTKLEGRLAQLTGPAPVPENPNLPADYLDRLRKQVDDQRDLDHRKAT